MPVSKELMLAILAMDSYNRGYEEGIEVSGTQIGNATLGLQSNTAANSSEVAAGFFAQAYSVNGEIVISYRGSDDLLDAWNDYLTILGNPVPGVPLRPIPPQVALALQSYDAFKALTMQAERHRSKSGVARLPQLGIVSNWNRGFTGDFRLAA